MIKYLVWDFDGTIADTDLCVLNNIKEVMNMYGIVEPDEMILDAMKKHDEKRARALMAEHLRHGVEELSMVLEERNKMMAEDEAENSLLSHVPKA